MNTKLELTQQIIDQMDTLRDSFHQKLMLKGKSMITYLTILQLEAYLLIGKAKSIKMSDLSTAMNLKAAGATQLIDKLIEHQIVVRKYNSSDRRTIYVELSEFGQQMHQKMKKEHDETMAEMYEPLSESELNQLLLILSKINV
jgi:DNA-binding MarR family transcriptional regulator